VACGEGSILYRIPPPLPQPYQTMQGILVAEDDANLRDVIAWSLRAEGYRVVTAADGLESLRILRGGQVGLAILDARMSWVNGLEVVARMRRDPLLRRIPALLLADSPVVGPPDVLVVPHTVDGNTLLEVVQAHIGPPRSSVQVGRITPFPAAGDEDPDRS